MLPDRAYTPPEVSVADLKMHLSELGMSRVVLIQPSFYGTDNSCLTDALQELGDSARGIAVIDENTSDEALSALAGSGVRGVRVNLESIGIRDPQAANRALASLADRIKPHGWHIQIYASSGVIAASAGIMGKLSVHVVLDHFAMMQADKGPAQSDLAPVLELVRSGRAYVKLSAPYRISSISQAGPDYADVMPLAKAFIHANLDRILWASDWPHTDRAPGKKPTEISPFRQIDDQRALDLLATWGFTPEVREKILVENPARLYGF
jgi:predicted TIM-barrel fold metal-dependent hydrolase